MHQVISAFLGLALAVSAYGSSMEFPITPTHLEHGRYAFAISGHRLQEGASFQVTITVKTGTFLPNSSLGLKLTSGWPVGFGGLSIDSLPGAPPIVLNKTHHRWQASVKVSRELLTVPGLLLVFTVYPSPGFPDVEFYGINLRDFLPPSPKPYSNPVAIQFVRANDSLNAPPSLTGDAQNAAFLYYRAMWVLEQPQLVQIDLAAPQTVTPTARHRYLLRTETMSGLLRVGRVLRARLRFGMPEREGYCAP